jgi:hypothetical protein
MTDVNVIPAIDDPMGAHWRQPSSTAIAVDDTHALMTRETFNALCEYSTSTPTGVYPGKMWRRQLMRRGAHPLDLRPTGQWFICWYGPDVDGKCPIETRRVLLADGDA